MDFAVFIFEKLAKRTLITETNPFEDGDKKEDTVGVGGIGG